MNSLLLLFFSVLVWTACYIRLCKARAGGKKMRSEKSTLDNITTHVCALRSSSVILQRRRVGAAIYDRVEMYWIHCQGQIDRAALLLFGSEEIQNETTSWRLYAKLTERVLFFFFTKRCKAADWLRWSFEKQKGELRTSSEISLFFAISKWRMINISS